MHAQLSMNFMIHIIHLVSVSVIRSDWASIITFDSSSSVTMYQGQVDDGSLEVVPLAKSRHA